jgi:hypothetical protein
MDVTGGAIASGDEGGLPGKSGADGAPEVLGLGWMRRTEEQEQSHTAAVSAAGGWPQVLQLCHLHTHSLGLV